MMFCEDAVMTIRKIALCTAAILIAATGFADARPDTRKMTCEQTQALIRSQHAAVLTTGQNTYDRYVRKCRCRPMSRQETARARSIDAMSRRSISRIDPLAVGRNAPPMRRTR